MAEYDNSEAVIISSLIGLAGDLAGHRTDVKNIRTSAQLERDKLAFEREKLESQKKLELDKAMFALRMDDLKAIEKERDEVVEQYTNRTGKIPENPTKAFLELHEKNGDISSYDSALSEATERARILEDDVKQKRQDIVDIDNALKFINKHQSYKGGTDPTRWDKGDYDEVVGKYKEKIGKDKFSDPVFAALDKAKPGDYKLDELNLKLMKEEIERGEKEFSLDQLDSKKLKSKIAIDRSIVSSDPRMSGLMADATQATASISQALKEDDKEHYYKEAKEILEQTNPIISLIGLDNYIAAAGASGKAPEYFIDKVIAPIVGMKEAYERFVTENLPPEGSNPEAVKAYKAAKADFLLKLTKGYGLDTKTELISEKKLLAALGKLENIFGDQDVKDSTILMYSDRIRRTKNMLDMVELGPDSVFDVVLPPDVEELLEVIKSFKGQYSKDMLEQLNIEEKDDIVPKGLKSGYGL
jgi:hypothetical protein